MADSIEEEISLLNEAVSKLSAACGSYNIDLYKVRGQLMTSYLVAEDFNHAMQQCHKLVHFISIVFYHIPFHPLLGLQLFTLGMLYIE
jgi:hypothetical protein